jgi:GNAT superfamily N-acetyltransferase
VKETPFVIEALASKHDRDSFACGNERLDRYFRQQATQDIRRRIATCFVIVEAKTGVVAGYYTLTATNVLLRDLPEKIAAKLPRHAAIPAVLLGRLAVATSFQGQKLGAALLADAIERSARVDIATFAIVVDPIDEQARQFYQKHGFIELPQPERQMFIPITSALQYIEKQKAR